MTLISCPECNHNVSDQATSCPNCGHPLQQDRGLSLYNILSGKRWKARSHSLAGGDLDITFMNNGIFAAILTGDGNYFPLAQQVNGKWQVIESQLFLDYAYIMLFTMGFNQQQIPSKTQFQIQFTQGSESKLLGVDAFARAWELERIG